MKNEEIFLRLPNELMNVKHQLHYELFNFDSNKELKVFIAILAYSTTIFMKNKKKGKQTFSTVGFLADNRFLPNTIKYPELERIINNMRTPFFDILFIENKQVSFKLSNTYIRSTLKKGFQKINLMSLKSTLSLKATKLAILTTIKPNAYLGLNYLLKVLRVNPNLRRVDRIREIKTAFKALVKLGMIDTWNYQYPKKGEETLPVHYKFHYENVINELSEEEENKILKSVVEEPEVLTEEESKVFSSIGHTDYLKYTKSEDDELTKELEKIELRI